MKMKKLIVTATLSLVTIGALAQEEKSLSQELNDSLQGMFDGDPNAEPDLLVQLTKETSRRMMLQLLAEMQVLLSSDHCSEAVDIIYSGMREEALSFIGYTQVYDADYIDYAIESPIVIDLALESETWNQQETMFYCAYHLGRVRGSISSLERAYYNPLLNLQTGEKSEELNAAITDLIMMRLRRGY